MKKRDDTARIRASLEPYTWLIEQALLAARRRNREEQRDALGNAALAPNEEKRRVWTEHAAILRKSQEELEAACVHIGMRIWTNDNPANEPTGDQS